MTPSAVIAAANAAGVTVWATDEGGLRYRTQRGTLPESLRVLLTTHKAALVAALATWAKTSSPSAPSSPQPPPEPWDQSGALSLQHEVDGLVEQLGVPGSHPDLQPAIAEWSTAFHGRDLAECRRAASVLILRARTLADSDQKDRHDQDHGTAAEPAEEGDAIRKFGGG